MSRKIFIFGIDSASLDIILPEAGKGNLRNFKRLLEGGSWGQLRSTEIINSAVVWSTFMTGKNPGKHGVYDFFKVEGESSRPVSFSDIEDKPFWDLLVYVMQNIDTLQHYLWHYIDESHSRYRYDDFFSKVLFKFYKELDDFLGKIIDSMDEDTYLLVISDHGAGKLEREFFINNWLLKNKFLFLKNRPSTNLKRALMKIGLCEADFYNFFVAGNPLVRMVNSLRRSKKREKKFRTFYTLKDIDWKKTIAHGINYNQVFINANGDYEKVRDVLIAKLKEIKHPYKSRPLIDAVYKREDVFFGEKLSRLPDIVFVCDGSEINSPSQVKMLSPRIFDRGHRTGNHRLEGIIFFYGKGVKKNFRIKDADMADIPATVMALSEGVVPEDFDGKVLGNIFLEGRLGRIKKQPIPTKKEEKDKAYSTHQEEEVKKRLQSLGYM